MAAAIIDVKARREIPEWVEPRATLFKSGRNSDTLVISHYPVAGNDRNTGPRYQEEARLTSYDILGVTRVGSDVLRPSLQLKRALSVAHFDATCSELASELLPYCSHYKYIVARGQSTGTFPTLGILKSRVLPVTHLLIEDGINMRTGRGGSPRGALRGRLDWFMHTRRERGFMKDPPFEDWVAPERLPVTLKSVAKFGVEQYHWGALWRSAYSRQSLMYIAQHFPSLPILVKLFGHTGATTPADALLLKAQLEHIGECRRAASQAADLKVDYDENAWHGYLVYPQYGAVNLIEARGMLSRVNG